MQGGKSAAPLVREKMEAGQALEFEIHDSSEGQGEGEDLGATMHDPHVVSALKPLVSRYAHMLSEDEPGMGITFSPGGLAAHEIAAGLPQGSLRSSIAAQVIAAGMQPANDAAGQPVDHFYTGTEEHWMRALNALGSVQLAAARHNAVLPDVGHLWKIFSRPGGQHGSRVVFLQSLLPFNE